MLQNKNNFEILELLKKEPMHIRQIALNLNLIPSTVMRIMQTMEKYNLVDYKIEGKNKTYFIKNTLEYEIYDEINERYKLINLLNIPELRRIIPELWKETNGELIILFGSYAKGIQSKDSDIDIYVETENKKLKEKLELISSRLSIKIGKFNIYSDLGKEIIKNHVIIQNIERFKRIK